MIIELRSSQTLPLIIIIIMIINCSEECHRAGVFTQEQALKFIASKMKQKKYFGGSKKSPTEDAREMLANTVLAHVPIVNFNFKMKVKIF